MVKVKVKWLSRVRLFATPWTVAYHASPSMGFSRQDYWSGLPFPSPRDLPDPGIEPGSPSLWQTLYCLSHQGSHYILREEIITLSELSQNKKDNAYDITYVGNLKDDTNEPIYEIETESGIQRTDWQSPRGGVWMDGIGRLGFADVNLYMQNG